MRAGKPPLSPPPMASLNVDSISEMSSFHEHRQTGNGHSSGGAAASTRNGTPRVGKPGDSSKTGGEMCATKVFVRVRPFNQKELTTEEDGTGARQEDDGHPRCIVQVDQSKPSLITTLDPAKQFTPRNTYIFERCFNSANLNVSAVTAAGGKGGAAAMMKTLDEGTAMNITEADMQHAEMDQLLIFNHVGRPVLENAIEGYNGCVFAYGQTGSGKTFTMMGPPQLFGGTSGGAGGQTPGRRFSRSSTTNSPGVTHLDGAGAAPASGQQQLLVKMAQRAQGIIPRLAKELFAMLNRRRTQDSAISFRVELEYFEIYNEKVMDLLHSGPPGSAKELRVRNAASGPYVEGLQHCHVESVDDVLAHLRKGNSERHTASTKMNDRSSRSHAILSLYITQMRLTTVSEEGPSSSSPAAAATAAGGGGAAGAGGEASRARGDNEIVERRKSRINLVDLAGSERTGASQVTGKHFKEATNINLSLTTLGRVIDALADISQMRSHASGGEASGAQTPGRKGTGADGKTASSPGSSGAGAAATTTGAGYGVFVPYRDSNLTWLLRDSLGGNSKTTMIATVSPHASNFEEACQTLRYASRAKQIVTKAIVNEDPQQRLIKQLSGEVERLRRLLASGQADNSVAEEDGEYMEELRERVQALEAELADKTAELAQAEGEIVALRGALQEKASLAKTEVRAVTREGEAKAAKLRADVNKLESENLNMAVLEADLRKAKDKAATLERRAALVVKQAEKESKAQQATIRRLEKEGREWEAERERLRTLQADLKAAEDREAELVLRLRQMEQERQKAATSQRATVVAGDGALQLGEAAIQRLQAMGLLPQRSDQQSKGSGAGGSAGTPRGVKTAKGKSTRSSGGSDSASNASNGAQQPLQLGPLVDTLIEYAANAREEAGTAQHQYAELLEEHRRGQKDSDGATAAAVGGAGSDLGSLSSSRSHLARRGDSSSTGNFSRTNTAGPAAASPAGSPRTQRGEDRELEKKLTRRLRQAESEIEAQREVFEQERGDIRRQLLEKTDAFRRSQMELKRAREDLKAEKDQQAALERRLQNEHRDEMRRLQEEVREKKAAVKETKKVQGSLSAEMAANYEKALTETGEERDKVKAELAKLSKEHKALQKRHATLDATLATTKSLVDEMEWAQIDALLGHDAAESKAYEKDQIDAIIAMLPRREEAARAVIEKEATQSLQLLYTHDDVVRALARERTEMQEELAHSLAEREEQASRDRAVLEEALVREKSEKAETQTLLREFMGTVKELQETTQSLQQQLESERETAKSATAAQTQLQREIDVLNIAKHDLLAAQEHMISERDEQQGRIDALTALVAEAEEQHTAAMAEATAAHTKALEDEAAAHSTLTQQCTSLTSQLEAAKGDAASIQATLDETVEQHAQALREITKERDVALAQQDKSSAAVADAQRKLCTAELGLLVSEEVAQREGCARAETQSRIDLLTAFTRSQESTGARQVMALEKRLQETEQAHEDAARASQDDIEKRQADHRAELAALESRLDALQAASSAEAAALAAAKDTALSDNSQLHDTLEKTQKRLDDVEQELASTKVDSDAAATRSAEQLAALTAQIAARDEELAQARSSHVAEHETLQATIADLTQQRDTATGALATQEADSAASLAEKCAAIEQLEAQLAQARADGEQQALAIVKAKEESEAASESLQRELDAVAAAKAELEERIARQGAEHEAAEEAHREEKAALEAEVARLSSEREREVAAAEEQKEGQARTIAELKTRYGESLKTLASMEESQAARAEEHRAALAEKDDALAALRAEAESMTGAHEAALADLQAQLAAHTAAEGELTEALREAKEAQAETEAAHASSSAALSAQLEALAGEKDALQQRCGTLEGQLRQEQERCAELTSSVDAAAAALTAEKCAAEEQIQQLEKQRETEMQEHAALRDKAAEELAAAERRMSELTAAVAALEGDVAKSEESRRLLVQRGLETQASHAEETKQLQQDAEQQRVAAAEVERKLADTEDALRVLQDEKQSLADQHAAAAEKAEAAAQNGNRLAEELAAEKAAHASSKEHLAKLDADMVELKEARRAADKLAADEAESLRSEVAAAREELASTVAALASAAAAEKQSHEVAVGALHDAVATLENEKADQDRRLAQLQAELADQKEKLAAAEATHHETVAHHEQQTNALRSEMAGQQAKLEEATATVQQLDEEKRQTQSAAERQAADHQREIAESRAEAEGVRGELAAATEALNARLTEKEAALATAAEDLKKTREELTAANTALSTEQTRHSSDTEMHTAKLTALSAELDAAKSSHTKALANRDAAARRTAEEHATAVKAKEQSIRGLEASLADMAKSAAKVNLELAALAKKHEALEHTAAEQQREAAATKERLETELAELQGSLENKEGELAAVTSERDGLQGSLSAATEAAAQQSADATQREADLTAAADDLSAKLAATTQARADLERELCTAQEQLASVEAQLAEAVREGEAQTLHVQLLEERLQQTTQDFTAAAERQEKELAQMREDLEFRTSLDMYEADTRGAVTGPLNGSFSMGTSHPSVSVSASGAESSAALQQQQQQQQQGVGSAGGSNTGPAGASRFEGILSFFGRGGAAGVGAGGGSAGGGTHASVLNRSFRGGAPLPPMAPPKEAAVGALSRNASFTDMTVHEMLSSSSLHLAGAHGGLSAAAGAPALFERRNSTYAGGGRRHGSATAAAARMATPTNRTGSFAGTPVSQSSLQHRHHPPLIATTDSPLQPQQENVAPPPVRRKFSRAK